MMDKLRFAIIGCGDIAGYMALAMTLNPAIRLVACADIDPGRAGRLARRFRIPHWFADHAEMIKAVKPDAVYLSVPHFLHFPMLTQLISAGIHVFCEKPVTISLNDAIAVRSLAFSHGVRVGVNYQYRYDRSCYALAMASRRGRLGELYYGRCNVPWQRSSAYFEQGPWRGVKEQAGGGTLLTQASHALDVLLWSLGGKPVAAQGVTARLKFPGVEVEDLAMGVVEMDNGAMAQVTGSMIARPEQPVSIEVYGSLGTALYRGPGFSRVDFRGARVIKEPLPVRGAHALFRSLEAYRRWVVADKPYFNTVGDSLAVLAAVDAIYRSAATGRREPIDHRIWEVST